jgi:hypothetical protein
MLGMHIGGEAAERSKSQAPSSSSEAGLKRSVSILLFRVGNAIWCEVMRLEDSKKPVLVLILLGALLIGGCATGRSGYLPRESLDGLFELASVPTATVVFPGEQGQTIRYVATYFPPETNQVSAAARVSGFLPMAIRSRKAAYLHLINSTWHLHYEQQTNFPGFSARLSTATTNIPVVQSRRFANFELSHFEISVPPGCVRFSNVTVDIMGAPVRTNLIFLPATVADWPEIYRKHFAEYVEQNLPKAAFDDFIKRETP